MKIIAIKEMSAGNDSVGDMWKETKIFSESTPVCNIIAWGKKRYGRIEQGILRRQLILTEADEE